MDYKLPFETTIEVRDHCLCLATQRAARALARRFDQALKPVGLTNGQFSLLHALNRPSPARITELAPFLAMDRTTLTAALKVLERDGLVTITPDTQDKRNRLITLTSFGHAVLSEAMPLWRAEHAALESQLRGEESALRSSLGVISTSR